MSVHININSPDRISLVELWRLIFKFTFEKKNCAHTTKKTIESNLLKWNGFLQLEKARIAAKYGVDENYVAVGKKGSVLDEIEYQVGYMSVWLVKEENGEFQSRVDTYKRNNIDYRLVEPMSKVFPECKKLRNYARGRAALTQAMKDHPEDYQ